MEDLCPPNIVLFGEIPSEHCDKRVSKVDTPGFPMKSVLVFALPTTESGLPFLENVRLGDIPPKGVFSFQESGIAKLKFKRLWRMVSNASIPSQHQTFTYNSCSRICFSRLNLHSHKSTCSDHGLSGKAPSLIFVRAEIQ